MTVYFADRPNREVGHIDSGSFVALWSDGENSFEADPPNAVLSYLEPGSTPPEDTVVVLSEPHMHAGDLTYTVEVLEGTLPAKASACSLFIDPFGRPLSPVSGAGVHRRNRRRRRRRF